MKTYSLIFGLLFSLLGVCTGYAVALGAKHQIVMAIPCIIMAIVFLHEALQKEK